MSYALTFISVACTVASVIGAIRSNIYYTKSKNLTIYANTNVAYIESKKIINTLTEILKIAGSINKSIPKKRGINYEKQLSENGENIKNSMNIIRENLSVKDFGKINNLLNSQQYKVNIYIDSLITGSVVVNNKFVIDDFNICENKFYDMQLLIKKKLEDTSKKLK